MKIYNLLLALVLVLNLSKLGAQTYFIEDSSVVIVEVESVRDLQSWELHETSIAEDTIHYIRWTGSQYLNNPGNLLLEYKIKINNPGIYRFIWNSKVGKGSDPTEHNDDWLRFPDAADFYGYRSGTSSTVRPKGICTNDCPNGAGKDGWFKVYSSHTTDWTWVTFTSDNDPHLIYAKFDTAGIYTVQISARSSYHLLNRFVLYKEDVYKSEEVTKLSLPESRMFPFNPVPQIVIIGDSLHAYQLLNVDADLDTIILSMEDSSSIADFYIEETEEGDFFLFLKGMPGTYKQNKISISAVTNDFDTITVSQSIIHLPFINRQPTIDLPGDQYFDIAESNEASISLTGISDGNDGSQQLKFYLRSTTPGIIGNTSVNYTQGEDTARVDFTLLRPGSTRLIIEITDDGGIDLGGSDQIEIDFLIDVDNTTSTAIFAYKTLDIYPNPASNVLNIRSEDIEIKSLSIIGLNGKKQMVISQPENQPNIDVSQLPEALYFIKVIDGRGNTYSGQFFKN